jgi:hypothetical protein
MWRRLRKEAEGARNDLKRRDREDDNDSENAPAKRIDIKYDEVDLLTLKCVGCGRKHINQCKAVCSVCQQH